MTHRLIKCTIILMVVLIICYFALSFFSPWSPINCWHQDVDIRTGRLRFIRYLLFCKISERIEDSPLSKVLPIEMVAGAKPDWHRVNTLSPGVHHSPHYLFHSAIHQINTLATIWKMSEIYSFPKELKQKTARHLLALWEHSGNDSIADYYIHGLYDLMDEDKRQQILTALFTLQMPLIETNGDQLARTVFFPNGQAMDRIHGYVSPSGDFIRHGIWERWWSDGTRSQYGHFENDQLHGRRFEWDQDGKLIVIEEFNLGKLSEYESENLEQHPAYNEAQQIKD